MEKTLSLSEAKMKFNSLVEAVDGRDDEFIITKNGHPVAALVPAAVYEGWRETREILAHPGFRKEIHKGIARLRRKGRRFTFEEVFDEDL
ncbi:MAG: type II toxin-antitoxin system Phd/YefM family antitoxin [Deltaproteobacteria bacterium]|nr:type II toxin-antitoxin system Phd/YefM family antitoxin [Deltaproteobacteria bacterium]